MENKLLRNKIIEFNESLESINETIDNMIDTLQRAKEINNSTMAMINITGRQISNSEKEC